MSIVLNISGKSDDHKLYDNSPKNKIREVNIAPQFTVLSSDSHLDKKNKYILRDFLGLDNDFYRDDPDRDCGSPCDRK